MIDGSGGVVGAAAVWNAGGGALLRWCWCGQIF